MPHHLVAQLIGFIAVAFSLAVFQVNKRNGMLLLTIVASLLYTCHFYLLGAYSGSIMNLIGAVRSYVFKRQGKNQSVLTLSIFSLFFVVGTFITWQGPESLLPLGGTLAGSIAFWQLKPKRIRFIALISPPLWFTYNIIVGSYAGMFIEIINFSSNMIGIYRFDWPTKRRPESKF